MAKKAEYPLSNLQDNSSVIRLAMSSYALSI